MSSEGVFVFEPRKQTGPGTITVTLYAKRCNRGCLRWAVEAQSQGSGPGVRLPLDGDILA